MLSFFTVLYFTLFYLLLHLLSERYFVSKIDEKILAKLSIEDRIDLPEKFPSAVNGLIVGALGIYIIFLEKVFEGNIIDPYPQIIDLLFSSYVGYTIYDIGVMLTKPKEEVSMWVHHLVGLIGSILMPMYRKGAFFPLIFTITEITVIPTNLVWVLQRIEMKDSPLYSYGLFFRAIFFLVFRSFITPFLFYYALNNPGDISPYSTTLLTNYDTSLPSNIILNSLTWEEKYFILRSNLSKIPFIITALSSFFIFVLGLLNTVWSVVIVNNYLMRVLRKSKRKTISKDTITNNTNLKVE